MNLPALLAGLAAAIGAYGHGVLGHRWLAAQLRSVEMEPTPVSMSFFGDRNVSWRIFSVTWHSVTAVLLISSAALFLSAFGALESRDLLRFVAIVYATFLVLGVSYIEKRLDALVQPIPLLFGVVMSAVALFAWMASS